MKTLQDYWAHPVPTDAEGEALVLESLAAYPGVSVAELLRAHSRLPVDLIWAMLSTCLIFTDLEATLLTRHEQVFLYRTEAEMAQAKAHASAVTLRSLPSALVLDSRLWQAEIRDEVVILRPEVGTPLQLPVGLFQRMVSDGQAKMVSEAAPSPMTEDMR